MTKLLGPLFSRSATATLAKLLTFVRTGQATKARHRVDPDDPRSGLQISARAMLRFLASQWAALTAAQKLTWVNRAALTNVSPYHAYLARNLQLWRGFHAPSKSDPWTGTGNLGRVNIGPATDGVHHVHITFTSVLTDDVWSIRIHRATTTGFTASRANLVHVLPRPTTTSYTWIDHALPVGGYYYKFYHCMHQGRALLFYLQLHAHSL